MIGKIVIVDGIERHPVLRPPNVCECGECGARVVSDRSEPYSPRDKAAASGWITKEPTDEEPAFGAIEELQMPPKYSAEQLLDYCPDCKEVP